MRIDPTPSLNMYIEKILGGSKRGEQWPVLGSFGEQPPVIESFSEVPIGPAAVLDDKLMDKLGLRSISDSMIGQGGDDSKITIALTPNITGLSSLRSATKEMEIFERKEHMFQPVAKLRECYCNILVEKDVPDEGFLETALELYQVVYDHISSFEEGKSGIGQDALDRAFAALDKIFEDYIFNAFLKLNAANSQAPPNMRTSVRTEAEGLTSQFMQTFRQFRDLGVGLDSSFGEALKSLSQTNSNLALLVLGKTKGGVPFGSAQQRK